MTDAPGVSYDGHDLEALFALDNYQRWIAHSFAPFLRGEAVEFGAGIGAMSRHLRPLVERLDLVEPSTNLVTPLRQRFAGDAGVRVIADSLEAALARLPAGGYDACVLVNLLEHIADDTQALAGMRRILRPGGHLLLFVPALPWLFSPLDALVGHRRRYTRAGLHRIVAAANLAIVDLRYFDLLGVLPWWLVNTLGGKRSFDPRMARLYDRIGVPLTRAFERALRPPLGKNLILVARRDG